MTHRTRPLVVTLAAALLPAVAGCGAGGPAYSVAPPPPAGIGPPGWAVPHVPPRAGGWEADFEARARVDPDRREPVDHVDLVLSLKRKW
mgnify:CR=1 FL=1